MSHFRSVRGENELPMLMMNYQCQFGRQNDVKKETALLEVLGETYLDTFLCSGYSYLGLCYLRQANFLKEFLHMLNAKRLYLFEFKKNFKKSA